MGGFLWDDTLAIGIPVLDEQHKTWLQHLDALAIAIERKYAVPQVVETLDFLVDYTNFHFSSEEAQMAEAGYPWLEEHRRKHEDLRETLRTLLLDYDEDGPTQRLVETVNDLLLNWLVRHIREVDGKFAAYLKESGR